ncbi:MAG TPA: ATP-binding protein [Streptosporangiaceae bacterium]|nr:ATP-binding protein [Streptosporangiaceae bacterium]
MPEGTVIMEGTRQPAPDESAAQIDLAALPSASFWARRHVQAILKQWQMSREAVETAELLASELVTNAVRFAADPSGRWPHPNPGNVAYISMTLRHIPGLLVIEVSDQNMNVPEVKDSDLDSEGGRGLMLVQALSKEWSYYFPRLGWKTVYCVISI